MKVLMPQLGETVVEGTVAVWHKQPGDEVAKDEILADVETDKTAVEIPAPAAGVIESVLVPEGETVDVGTVLAVIRGADSAAPARLAEAAGATPVTVPAAAGPPGAAPSPRADGVARRGGRPRLSPVVRRLLAEHRLDPAEVPGSGRDGRITRTDVLTFLESRSTPAETPPTPAPPAAPASSDADRVPFDRIRRVTAEHMVRSKATSPHVLQAVEADFGAVDGVRLRLRERWRADHGFSLTYLPFVARATCLALRDFPRLNGSVDGDGLILHKRIHLCVAVDLNLEGLVAPVIRDADGLTVSGLAHRIHEISTRARQADLGPDAFSGGTYTLSNNGSFGTLMTAPIINQPQVGILSIDAVRKRPVVIEGPHGDSIAIRPVGILSQSFDHRAVDGAYSAAFLNRIRTLLEDKDWSAEV